MHLSQSLRTINLELHTLLLDLGAAAAHLVQDAIGAVEVPELETSSPKRKKRSSIEWWCRRHVRIRYRTPRTRLPWVLTVVAGVPVTSTSEGMGSLLRLMR